MNNIIIDQRNAIFLFPFYENGATCNILLCPKYYIGMYLMDMVGNLVYFVECTLHQAFIKTHVFSHGFRIFQATGFQNIGKLNAISNEILSIHVFIINKTGQRPRQNIIRATCRQLKSNADLHLGLEWEFLSHWAIS